MGLFSQKKPEREITADSLSVDHSAGFLAEVWEWMKSVVVALLIVLLIHQYGFHLSTVKGASMQPTIEEGEWLFINKTILLTGGLQRGDVVVVKEPDESDTEHPYLVKRVVAVAGDEVSIRQGKLYVNGEEAKESYTDTLIEDGRFEPYKVEEGRVFVMGDNRHRYASYDSRSFGAVSVKQVEGRAEWIVWPLAKWKNL
ncbi:signal peptidase I [Paenibacillus vulneris]|uniref:Signal peptidase I n=1 Tax=Paenibacillus vulneris TaxID=1133364 RepID=A0ABW3UMN4_9BACL|nr:MULTISPECIES: signal peptidase I [unclassified Paenibacillus]MBE1443954.1 signal peptidase I [Paenibacillus sp. OAS669]